jgi:hypothetical protein
MNVALPDVQTGYVGQPLVCKLWRDKCPVARAERAPPPVTD